MNENSISIFINTYPNNNKYLPMIEKLGDRLNKFYGMGIPRGSQMPIDLKRKLKTTKMSSRISGFIVKPMLAFFHMPRYYGYWANVKLLDWYFAKKVSCDDSKILFTSPLLVNTVRKAKRAGKFIVLEAGNSEPKREHQRIMDEYIRFDIKHKYIYGNSMFRDTCLESFKLADKIITISKVSRQTYIDAGYPGDKLEMIPLTGTDFLTQPFDAYQGKQKAFITTAFHNFIKGTHRLLLAWKKADIKNIPLIIVGSICEDLQEFIDKYGPFENVIFVGHQNVKDFYSTRDAVGVLLSLSEGAGRVTPEMMSFGYPMIVSSDATCDLVVDGENGFVVDPFDENSIIDRIKWFADDWNHVYEMRNCVLSSVTNRSVKQWSVEVADYLQTLL